MKGHLHLIEKLDHVFRLKDGSGLWVSGYWELSDVECRATRRVYLHTTKADRSHWGGDVIEIRPAGEFGDMARSHNTDPAGRWVFIVRPDLSGKGALWEGDDYRLAYKALV